MDEKIDLESTNRNQQWFEKAISGYYLGEMVRIVVLKLYEEGEVRSFARSLLTSFFLHFESQLPRTFRYYYSFRGCIIARRLSVY